MSYVQGQKLNNLAMLQSHFLVLVHNYFRSPGGCKWISSPKRWVLFDLDGRFLVCVLHVPKYCFLMQTHAIFTFKISKTESTAIYGLSSRNIYYLQNSLLFRRQVLQLCLTVYLRMQMELNNTNASCHSRSKFRKWTPIHKDWRTVWERLLQQSVYCRAVKSPLSQHPCTSFLCPSSVLPVVEHSLGCRSESPVPDFTWEYGKRPNIRLEIPRATHWSLVLRPGPTVCCVWSEVSEVISEAKGGF